MMGATKPTIAEDHVVSMEDVFGDPYPEGQQVNMASPEAAEVEMVEPKLTMIEEVIMDRGQEEAQVEEGLLVLLP